MREIPSSVPITTPATAPGERASLVVAAAAPVMLPPPVEDRAVEPTPPTVPVRGLLGTMHAPTRGWEAPLEATAYTVMKGSTCVVPPAEFRADVIEEVRGVPTAVATPDKKEVAVVGPAVTESAAWEEAEK